MLDKIASIENRYEELGRLLEESASDYQRAAEYGKERSDLEAIVNKANEYRTAQKQIEEARSLQEENDAELRELARADLEALEPRLQQLERELQVPAGSQRPAR